MLLFAGVRRIRTRRSLLQSIAVAAVLAGVGVCSLALGSRSLSLVVREHRELRQLVNPTYAFYATYQYARIRQQLGKRGRGTDPGATARRARSPA